MIKPNETKFIDRTGWPAGPWDNESDKYEWRSQGFPCSIVRNWYGNLCGYVGVPPTHPLHGLSYDDDVYEDTAIDVHGGLTYASPCQEGGHICHIPQESEHGKVWWLGFDCAHHMDLSPRTILVYAQLGWEDCLIDTVYRTVDYVRAEVEKLAKQFAIILLASAK